MFRRAFHRLLPLMVGVPMVVAVPVGVDSCQFQLDGAVWPGGDLTETRLVDEVPGFNWAGTGWAGLSPQPEPPDLPTYLGPQPEPPDMPGWWLFY